MHQVGIRELKEQASEILRGVREEGKSVEITYRGKVIAKIIPVTEATAPRDLTSFWASWDELAQKIGERWPEGVSAVEAIREERRG
jgi:prevent-host-death family protein